jgi:hypothetical protein
MLMDHIKALWKGEIPLVRTYWLYFVVIGTLLELPLQLYPSRADYSLLGLNIYALLFFPYFPFIFVALWRAAVKYRGPLVWSVLARAAVVWSTLSIAREVHKVFT